MYRIIQEKMLKIFLEIRFEVLRVCDPIQYKIYRPEFYKI